MFISQSLLNSACFLSFFLFLDRKEGFWDPSEAKHSDSPVLPAEQNKTGFLRTRRLPSEGEGFCRAF